MSEPNPTTSMEAIAKEFGFDLWQEHAPHGPWFLETPEDGDIFFGSDIESAQQCRDAISRLCLQLKERSVVSTADRVVSPAIHSPIEKTGESQS